MAVDIGPKIGIQGEQEFRKELKQINEGIKTLGSEMKVVTSEFTNQEKSVESLTKENDVLNRTINSLNDKLDLQKKMLAECADKYGEADERTMKWQQAVNKTQAELNTATAKVKENEKAMDSLGNEMDDLGDETEDTGKALNDASKKALSFGDVLKANVLSEAIIGGVKALGGAIKDIASGMAGMVKDSAAAADEINTLAKKTGLSTDTIQKFQYAADVIDVPLDTLTGSLSKLTKTMNTARAGTGKAAENFKSLGISVTDESGALRDNEEVFKEIIEALGNIDNETERDAMAMELLGKSAQDLNPLILGGADALEELGQKAEEAGLILSGDELNNLNSIQDAMDEMTKTLQMAGMSLVSTFAEPLSEALNTLLGYVQRLTKAFKEGGLEGLAEELKSITEEFVGFLTDHIDEIGKFAEDILTTFIDMIVENLPDLIPAAVSLLVTLGMALIDHLDELIDAAFQIVKSLADEILKPDNLQKIIDAGIDLLVALVTDIPAIIAGLVEKLPEIIDGLVAGFSKPENVQKLEDAGRKIMKYIGEGILKAPFKLIDYVMESLGLQDSPVTVEEMSSGAAGEYAQGIANAYKEGTTADVSHGGGGTTWGSSGNYYDPALGGMVINIQTPESDTLATYITPSLGSSTKAYGQPLLNPYS